MTLRSAIAALATVSACLLVAGGCTSSDGDRRGSSGPPPASGTEPTPSEAPTGPPWPEYEPSDYSYVLAVHCFCADAGVPYQVTVRGGEVASVVYLQRSHGHSAGEPVADDATWLHMTINDIVDLANDDKVAEARVIWPSGQDYPRRVWIDPDENAIDEEIGYTIRSVAPA